eukprot:COSAG04_NODE_31023_length_259_cov_0.643750_1_plen_29_part_01
MQFVGMGLVAVFWALLVAAALFFATRRSW